MKTSIIDRITDQLEFFNSGVVLQSEKEQLFQSNREMKHETGFNENPDKDSALHPQYDPFIFDPSKTLFLGTPINVKKYDFNKLKNEDVKLHIGLIKPKDSPKSTRKWIISGNGLFVLFSPDQTNIAYFHPNEITVGGRFLHIRVKDNFYNYSIKSRNLSKNKGVEDFFFDVYHKGISNSFEYFFRSINKTNGYPPFNPQTRGFYRSLVEHPQFLFIFGSLATPSSLLIEITIIWLFCAHSVLPTIIPVLLQHYLETDDVDYMFERCFAAVAIANALRSCPQFSKSIDEHDERAFISEISKVKNIPSPVRYLIFLLFNEVYRKFKDARKFEKVFVEMINKVFGQKINASFLNSERIQKIVDKFCIFPDDFKLTFESPETDENIVRLLNQIFQEREQYSKIAHEIDVREITEKLENRNGKNFIVLPESDTVLTTDTQLMSMSFRLESAKEERVVSTFEPEYFTNEEEKLPMPPSKVSTTSQQPNASTNNMESYDKQSGRQHFNKQKDDINHIPNYTVDENDDDEEEDTEYSFESQTSEPIIIPPKPIQPHGFESDPETDDEIILPPQMSSHLKAPTKEQLEKVIGNDPFVQSPLPITLSPEQKQQQDEFSAVKSMHTLSDGDSEDSEEDLEEEDLEEEDKNRELEINSPKEGKENTTKSESVPICLSELRGPKEHSKYALKEEEEELSNEHSEKNNESKYSSYDYEEDDEEEEDRAGDIPTPNRRSIHVVSEDLRKKSDIKTYSSSTNTQGTKQNDDDDIYSSDSEGEPKNENVSQEAETKETTRSRTYSDVSKVRESEYYSESEQEQANAKHGDEAEYSYYTEDEEEEVEDDSESTKDSKSGKEDEESENESSKDSKSDNKGEESENESSKDSKSDKEDEESESESDKEDENEASSKDSKSYSESDASSKESDEEDESSKEQTESKSYSESEVSSKESDKKNEGSSVTDYLSIKSAAEEPNPDSLDTNDISPNMYTNESFTSDE